MDSPHNRPKEKEREYLVNLVQVNKKATVYKLEFRAVWDKRFEYAQ